MTKRVCCECGRRLDPYRPVARCPGGVTYVCRACWRALAYGEFMDGWMSKEDRRCLR